MQSSDNNNNTKEKQLSGKLKPFEREHELSSSSIKRLTLAKTWKLPFPGESRKIASYNKIKEEFQRLDVLGEGKLTYLTLRSALELHDIQVEDSLLRKWLVSVDRKSKGYVDLEDYVHIYEAMNSHTADDDDIVIGINQYSRNSLSLKNETRAEQRNIAREKLLKIAFDKYDLDRDGYISARDLQVAIQSGILADSLSGRDQSKFSLQDALEWIKLRDRSGNESVSFEDFYFYYK